MNMMNGLKVQFGVHYTDGGANVGFTHNLKNGGSGWSYEARRMMVQYKNAAGHEAGTDMTYDRVAKKCDVSLAARFNFADHNLAMKVNNAGTAQFLFGWRQNANITGVLGTKVSLGQLGKGRIDSFPLSMQFTCKY